jgi:hypothetical protein
MTFLTEDQKDKLKDFVIFAKNHLGLKSAPKVVLQNGKKDLRTTANYDYSNPEKVIKINAKNRMIVDVMRSIAHEMVHHRQFEQGRLDGAKPPDIGGEIEDEANAVAGQIIKLYAQEDKTIYDE